MPEPIHRQTDVRREPLFSELADDSDMMELIEMFVLELQDRIISLSEALDSGNRDELRSVAHQLKGSGAGHGFPDISTCAADVESTLLMEEAELSALSERVEALIQLCQRATT